MDQSAVVPRLNPHRTRITRPILRTPLFEPDRVHPTYLLTGDETAAQGLNWRDDLGRYRLNLPREPRPRGQECPRHMDTARCPMFASFCDANMGTACTPSQLSYYLFVFQKRNKSRDQPSQVSLRPGYRAKNAREPGAPGNRCNGRSARRGISQAKGPLFREALHWTGRIVRAKTPTYFAGIL